MCCALGGGRLNCVMLVCVRDVCVCVRDVCVCVFITLVLCVRDFPCPSYEHVRACVWVCFCAYMCSVCARSFGFQTIIYIP